MTTQREFVTKQARREDIPALVGISGTTGSGKTYSALRIATGMQSVSGGDIFMIDTEARRGLHYADSFTFKHVDFRAPFSPGDYLAAIDHCVKQGARIIIIDSMSHEHEGPGGVLEMHTAEVKRMCKGDESKAEKVKGFAWGPVKSAHRRMVNTILQYQCHFVFCMRAKEKLDWIKKTKGAPTPLGLLPIIGDDFIFELLLHGILYPGSNGVATWDAVSRTQDAMLKAPQFFRDTASRGRQFDEAMGAEIAKWARGGAIVNSAVPWPGKEEWSRVPIVDVPGEQLRIYRNALQTLHDSARGKKKHNIADHMSEVDNVLARLAPVAPAADSGFGDSEPGYDGPPSDIPLPGDDSKREPGQEG